MRVVGFAELFDYRREDVSRGRLAAELRTPSTVEPRIPEWNCQP
jgi:hypothetical protein